MGVGDVDDLHGELLYQNRGGNDILPLEILEFRGYQAAQAFISHIIIGEKYPYKTAGKPFVQAGFPVFLLYKHFNGSIPERPAELEHVFVP